MESKKAQTVIDALAAEGYGQKTDLKNEFSYAGGVRNITGVKRTGLTMNLKATNCTDEIKRFAICPSMVQGLPLGDRTNSNRVLGTGVIPFFDAAKPETGADSAFYIESMDDDQELDLIAGEMVHSPIFIAGLNMRSINVDTNTGDTTNFSNVLQHYFRTPWKGNTPSRKLELAKFHNKQDYQLTMTEIDFVKENFPGFISINDFLVFQIQPGTSLDIIVEVGARDSRAEYFNRQVKEGVGMLNKYSK